jgi:hypothetical protein
MPHKPFENSTPELIREELDKYFAHVQQHDPKSLEFALMVTGHKEADGDTHVCSMVAGSPQTLTRIIIELMGEMIERDPAFSALFHINLLALLGRRDAEAQTKDLLDRLRSTH